MNSDFDWDVFDSCRYQAQNYETLRDDDQAIISAVREFFGGIGIGHVRGIDVGSGTNLYPALAMLPFCDGIDLYELSDSNVTWLRGQLADPDGFDASWDPFWAEFARHPVYAAVTEPRSRLAAITTLRQASVFDLPAHSWDLGTMFFVACSISTDFAEFDLAVRRFVRSLRRGAPFAMAFMVQSQGYQVGDVQFPAVAIGPDEIDRTLAGIAYDVNIQDIETGAPLRDGYHGMSLVTGWSAG